MGSSNEASSTPVLATPVPDEFLCPLTLDIMVDPVMDAAGHNFERSAIMAWMCREGNKSCPLTRKDLKPKDLAPNTKLRMKIEQWRSDHACVDQRLKDKDSLQKNSNSKAPVVAGHRKTSPMGKSAKSYHPPRPEWTRATSKLSQNPPDHAAKKRQWTKPRPACCP